MLLVLYIMIKSREVTLSTSGKIFNRLIWVNIYMLILEILSWQFDGKLGNLNYILNYGSNMLFAWSTPLITCVWISYIDYHMHGSYERLKKGMYFMQPMIIMTLFILINFFQPFIFSVNESNVYSREPFMWLIILLNTSALFYKWLDVYLHRGIVRNNVVFAMFIFILLPSIAAIIQVFVYGAFIIWPIMSVTLVISYIYLETVSTSTDYLTGLKTRSRIDDHVDYLINQGKPFGLALIDLDKFKEINDQYGHVFGDLALQVFAKAISSSFLSKEIVGRYGGDEFIIITHNHSHEKVGLISENILKNLRIEEAKAELPFQIAFSLGYQRWNKNSNHSYSDILNTADQKMYLNKLNKETLFSEDKKQA